MFFTAAGFGHLVRPRGAEGGTSVSPAVQTADPAA
jgi:hypothetical protein